MIHPDIIRPRLSRIGTITTGYGVTATSQTGRDYSRPNRAKTLVFHTDDLAVANAVLADYGGEIRTDGQGWEFDVVTDVRQVELVALRSGWRSNLEQWRAGQCARRCDGITMSLRDGNPYDGPCVCGPEMASGADRACDPVTVLPVLIDLDVDRLGVWEVRSTSWGTAAAIAGAMQALDLAGAPVRAFPAVLSMVDRTTRDRTDRVREVTELHLTVAARASRLAEIEVASVQAVAGREAVALPAGDVRREELLRRWADIHGEAHAAGVLVGLRQVWGEMHGDARPEELSTDDLDAWVTTAARFTADASGSPESAGDVRGDTGTPDGAATAGEGPSWSQDGPSLGASTVR